MVIYTKKFINNLTIYKLLKFIKKYKSIDYPEDNEPQLFINYNWTMLMEAARLLNIKKFKLILKFNPKLNQVCEDEEGHITQQIIPYRFMPMEYSYKIVRIKEKLIKLWYDYEKNYKKCDIRNKFKLFNFNNFYLNSSIKYYDLNLNKKIMEFF